MCRYLIFPRTPVHLFRGMNILQQLLQSRKLLPRVTGFIQKQNPTVSALFLLPAFFAGDLVEAYGTFRPLELAPTEGTLSSPNHLKTMNMVNHFAHVGGLGSALAFHAFVSGPLKYRFFAFSWYEVGMRLVGMSAGLAVWTGISLMSHTRTQESELVVSHMHQCDVRKKTDSSSPL